LVILFVRLTFISPISFDILEYQTG